MGLILVVHGWAFVPAAIAAVESVERMGLMMYEGSCSKAGKAADLVVGLGKPLKKLR